MPIDDLKFKKLYFNDTSFDQLMRKRILHILLICSKYDAFILEGDGRIDEQIFNEYVSLNLRYPPQFIQANSDKEAMQIIEDENIDLVISMLSNGDIDTFDLAKRIKTKYPKKPIVVLTPFSREVSVKLSREDLSAIDYVFSWLGNADLILAITKLIEDRMNAEADINEFGVQAVLLVEDSIRFYSSYLPNLYKIIFKHSKDFMTEGLNEHQQMLRMRGRPKILLARTYEEAIMLFSKFKSNLLGVITDMSYKRDGVIDKLAGAKLCEMLKNEDPYMPILLQSSGAENEVIAKKINVGFINKNSKTLSMELRNFVIQNFAFGDFIFLDPDSAKEINRAFDLKSLQQKIFEIPDDSLKYHLKRNHFSKWLYARAIFPVAEMFKALRLEDFHDLDDARRYIFDTISSYRLSKGRGVIADFNKDRFDEYLIFSRIGNGSVGGKARGLAFIDSLLKRNRFIDKFEDAIVTIPRTVVMGVDVFDEFMEENNLYEIALSNASDSEILHAFVNSRLPFRIHEDLYAFMSVVNKPIAIRSSSLLEDSHYQPFAGIYSTYMISNTSQNERLNIEQLSIAIKSVYASVYFKDSKAYMMATSNVIDEEKMGIVLQEICGQRYGNRFYPAISGVARSINFYPIHPEKAEDGVVNIAFGLGKHIVDGGITLRFSPKFPKKIIQLSNPKMALQETQKKFFALDLQTDSFKPSIDDGINLLQLNLEDAEADKSIGMLTSTYDHENNILKDGTDVTGIKVLTFSNILNYNVFPLAEILRNILETSQKEMGKPVEIEFAVDLHRKKGSPNIFNVLQIRPIVDNKETLTEDIELIKPEDTLIYSHMALGNGIIEDIYDIVYVVPEKFKPALTKEIAACIGNLNNTFLSEKKNYILVGPGRWGSSDPWLGVPVKWPQISAARVIIESGLDNFRIDPSQGTHFFQNLTSFKVGYFTINPFNKDGFYDVDYLSQFEPVYQDEFIRHIRFENPLIVKIDGKKGVGLVLKPKETEVGFKIQ